MGLLGDFISQTYPPAPKFGENDVPDLSGKIVIVTGGNTGIGKETARVLLAHNAKVYIACRSPEKAKAAVDELKAATGKQELHVLGLDLTSFASIRSAAEEFKSKESRLDILFNNAGVMSPPIEKLTEEGYDLQFGTNVLGPFLFTTLLMPVLLETAKENGEARVVNTSSLGHVAGSKEAIEWDTLKPAAGSAGDKARTKMGPDGLYYQSKRGIILLSDELAKRYGSQGIISTSLHPGTIQSELGRHWGPVQKFLTGVFIKLQPVSMGAITQLYAGTSPEAKAHNGKYLIPYARVGKPRADLENPELADKLWRWMEEQVAETAPSGGAS